MRLVNGPNSYTGTVEVFYEGQFGTICDDGWDDTDADIVCRQVGYSGGTAYGNALYGSGSGEILLDEVACDGTEINIADCNHDGWRSHDCNHGEDAGVACGKILLIFEKT